MAILPQQTWCQGVWQQATQQFETLEQPGVHENQSMTWPINQKASWYCLHLPCRLSTWHSFMTSPPTLWIFTHLLGSCCSREIWASPTTPGQRCPGAAAFCKANKIDSAFGQFASTWDSSERQTNTRSTKRGLWFPKTVVYVYICIHIALKTVIFFPDSMILRCLIVSKVCFLRAWIKLLGELQPLNPASYLTDYPFYHHHIYYPEHKQHNWHDDSFNAGCTTMSEKRKRSRCLWIQIQDSTGWKNWFAKLNCSSNIVKSHMFRTPNFQA